MAEPRNLQVGHHEVTITDTTIFIDGVQATLPGDGMDVISIISAALTEQDEEDNAKTLLDKPQNAQLPEAELPTEGPFKVIELQELGGATVSVTIFVGGSPS